MSTLGQLYQRPSTIKDPVRCVGLVKIDLASNPQSTALEAS
jgi:hypothetical protein